MAAQLKNEVENNVKNTEVNQNQTDAESNGSSVLNFVLWLVVITLLCAAVAGNYFFNKFYADLFASNSLYALLKGLAVVVIILIAVVVALFTTTALPSNMPSLKLFISTFPFTPLTRPVSVY